MGLLIVFCRHFFVVIARIPCGDWRCDDEKYRHITHKRIRYGDASKLHAAVHLHRLALAHPQFVISVLSAESADCSVRERERG